MCDTPKGVFLQILVACLMKCSFFLFKFRKPFQTTTSSFSWCPPLDGAPLYAGQEGWLCYCRCCIGFISGKSRLELWERLHV